MALQNIGIGNRDDAFYRYKMPRLVTKIEGRGNGIKTNLVNMVDVAKALARSPAYITKFYGCELGAQSKFDERTGTAIVNGAHETAKLAALLENFIKKYVQCYGCGNPETEVIVTKSQMITLKCAACGFISNVDMRDKLTTFILKNPPAQKSKKKGLRKGENERIKEGEAVDAEMKRVKKEIKKKGHDDERRVTKKKGSSSDEEGQSSTSSGQVGESDDAAEDDVEWQTDTSAKAAQQRIKEQLNSATADMVMLNTISDDTENDKNGSSKALKGSAGNQEPEGNVQSVEIAALSDGSKENDTKAAVKKAGNKEPKGKVQSVEIAALSDGNKENGTKAAVKRSDSATFESGNGALYDKLLKDFKGCLDNKDNADQMAAYVKVTRPGVSQQEVMNAYFYALFDGVQKGFTKEIGKKKLFLSKAIVSDQDQGLLLGAVEAYFSSKPLETCKEIAVLLKTMYDLDILEEGQILAWYEKGSRNKVMERARPFVEWLQNAESEEEE